MSPKPREQRGPEGEGGGQRKRKAECSGTVAVLGASVPQMDSRMECGIDILQFDFWGGGSSPSGSVAFCVVWKSEMCHDRIDVVGVKYGGGASHGSRTDRQVAVAPAVQPVV